MKRRIWNFLKMETGTIANRTGGEQSCHNSHVHTSEFSTKAPNAVAVVPPQLNLALQV